MNNHFASDNRGNNSSYYWRIARRAAVLTGLAAFALAGTALSSSEPVFHPAELVSAEGIFHPYLSVAWGPVILEASVGADGDVTDVVATRPIASLSEPSIRAIRNWKFKPATLNDKAVSSRVTIAVLFDSHVLQPFTLPAAAEDQELPKSDVNYEPPAVIAVQGGCVGNAVVGDGSVVLQAKVNTTGELNYASVVRDSQPFTPVALKAIENWKFKPAKFGSAPMTAPLEVVFVFQIRRDSNTY